MTNLQAFSIGYAAGIFTLAAAIRSIFADKVVRYSSAPRAKHNPKLKPEDV